MGNEKVFITGDFDTLQSFQLIPINDDSDAEKLRIYLGNFLRDKETKILGDVNFLQFLTTFINLDEKTAYVFISAVINGAVFQTPYKKGNLICFELDKRNRENNPYVSLWIFYQDKKENFRIRLIMGDQSNEFGMYSLLPEYFKLGTKVNEKTANFNIIAFGEYFDEEFIEFSPNSKNEYQILEFKLYLDTLKISKGSLIGFKYEYVRESSAYEKEFTFRIIHPVYMEGPEKGSKEISINKMCQKGRPDNLIWQFSEDYEMVPGQWIFQIYDNGQKEYEKVFHIKL
jgi:hypothetical protein